MKRATWMALGIALLGPSLGCEDDTFGLVWQGDSSQCISTRPDSTIQTVGGDVGGIYQEWGGETGMEYGHPGCDDGYVIDYLMPNDLDNNNPGWDWAWIHVASRIEDIDEDTCGLLWTSMQVYAYWTYQGAPQEELIAESYRNAEWVSGSCDLGIPDDVWMSSAYDRVRVASQHGAWAFYPQPQYSYFVTNNDP